MAYYVQFYPNRIVTTQKDPVRFGDAAIRIVNRICNENSLKNLSEKKKTINLSKSSKRLIRDSINAMYVLSKPRTIKPKGGKIIYNYRQSFITLTLPAEQRHSDVEIKQCLNNFLGLLRKYMGIQNYVWRAELQKNQNIHFHLVVDKYCSYYAMRYYWNKSINKLGYVDRYKEKMSSMSFSKYKETYNLDHNVAAVRYAKGCRSGWNRPNSVDVFSVRTDKDVAYYISKYFSKDESKNDETIDEAVLTRYELFGRVWSRSQSLSKLKFINKFELSEINDYLTILLKNTKGVFSKSYDYCKIIYLSLSKIDKRDLKLFYKIHIGNAIRYDYPFPT